MQTMQQKRAKYALEEIEKLKHTLNQKEQKECKSYASAFPAMIHTNGLGQAVAFYRSKKGTHERLYDLLSRWLTQAQQPYSKHNDLLKGLTEEDMHHYRAAQAEAQALMDWVKKFAIAFLDDDYKNQKAEEKESPNV